MRLSAITLALMASALLMLRPSAADAEPQVTYLYPSEGDVLAEPPTQIRMCFASPVNNRDLHAGGDFQFNVVTPDGIPLGLRIVFDIDARGVTVFPGLPEDAPDGEWLFEWRVTDPDTLDPATGAIAFTVSPDGSPQPEELPESCLAATPVSAVTPTPVPDVTSTATPATAGEEDGDGLDTLAISLIAAASLVGAAAAAGLILRLIRRRKR